MASNRIGALYAEVILDPRGYSRGVSKVQSEQKLLASAIKDTTSPIDRLQAEIDSIDNLFDTISSKEPFKGQDVALNALLEKTQLLADEIKRLEELPAKEKKEADEKVAQKAAKEEEKRQEQLRKKQEETLEFLRKARDKRIKEEKDRHENILKAIEEAKDAEKRRVDTMVKNFQYLQRVKSNTAKREQDEIKEQERKEKQAAQEKIRQEKEIAKVESERSLKRLTNFKEYLNTQGGLRILYSDIMTQVKGINGGLSKMAGNLAQAAGATPAMQGLARVLGSIGLKAVGVGLGLNLAFKALKASVSAAETLRVSLLRLEVRLGGNSEMAAFLNRQMENLAIQAGVSAQSTRELATSLLTMGVAAGEIGDTGKLVAQLSEGDPNRMKSVAKAYSDTIAKTRLMGQEALQFSNAQIPIYERLKDVLNLSKNEVMEMIGA